MLYDEGGVLRQFSEQDWNTICRQTASCWNVNGNLFRNIHLFVQKPMKSQVGNFFHRVLSVNSFYKAEWWTFCKAKKEQYPLSSVECNQEKTFWEVENNTFGSLHFSIPVYSIHSSQEHSVTCSIYHTSLPCSWLMLEWKDSIYYPNWIHSVYKLISFK